MGFCNDLYSWLIRKETKWLLSGISTWLYNMCTNHCIMIKNFDWTVHSHLISFLIVPRRTPKAIKPDIDIEKHFNRSRNSFSLRHFSILLVTLSIFSALSYNHYFLILGTPISSIVSPTLSTKQRQRTVILEIRDLDIKKVLSLQLSLFSCYCVWTKESNGR